MATLKFGLATKLAVCMMGSLLIIFGILSVHLSETHSRHLEEAVIDAALRINDTLDTSLHYNMLRNQCSDVFELMQTIGSQKGIERIRIFNSTGEIEYSTDANEIGTNLDKNAESCYVCHSEQKPLSRLTGSQRWRIFRDSQDNRVLGMINPIRNDPGCSNSESCHYHPPDLQVLGVLDVNMSLKEVDQQLAVEQANLITAYVLAMIAVALISVLFIGFLVHRPVKRLIEGTKRAARGELDQKLQIKSQDELGALAESFNRMTEDLKKAREEITDWAKTLEQRVREKTAELERTNEQIIRIEKMASLGKLSAIVAHEINNPLTGVLTYAKLLQKKIDKRRNSDSEKDGRELKDLTKYLDVIEHETARCGDIVKNLLLFSKKSTISFEPNDINSLLEKSIKLIRHQLELKSIGLVANLDPKVPPVICDSGQVQQIFVALLINSSEATEEEGKITVKTGIDPSGEGVVFSIMDNGIGMDQETMKHIFEPFFTTKSGGYGSGLGLAVVYGIVERHGGRISVDSQVGKGTTVEIRLPLRPPVEILDMEIPESAPPDRL